MSLEPGKIILGLGRVWPDGQDIKSPPHPVTLLGIGRIVHATVPEVSISDTSYKHAKIQILSTFAGIGVYVVD